MEVFSEFAVFMQFYLNIGRILHFKVRKQLFEIHVCSSKAHVLHPKILTMCGVISERRKATDGAATMPAGAKVKKYILSLLFRMFI